MAAGGAGARQEVARRARARRRSGGKLYYCIGTRVSSAADLPQNHRHGVPFPAPTAGLVTFAAATHAWREPPPVPIRRPRDTTRYRSPAPSPPPQKDPLRALLIVLCPHRPAQHFMLVPMPTSGAEYAPSDVSIQAPPRYMDLSALHRIPDRLLAIDPLQCRRGCRDRQIVAPRVAPRPRPVLLALALFLEGLRPPSAEEAVGDVRPERLDHQRHHAPSAVLLGKALLYGEFLLRFGQIPSSSTHEFGSAFPKMSRRNGMMTFCMFPICR